MSGKKPRASAAAVPGESSDRLPPEVSEPLAGFGASIVKLEAALEPILSAGAREISAKLEPLERAQLHTTLAHAANALFVLFLKSQGVDPEGHPVRKEAERVQLYLKKVKDAMAARPAPAKPTTGIDVAAVNRFIEAAVPELNSQQKAALKAAGQEAQEKRTAGAKKGRPAEPAERPAPAAAADSLLRSLEGPAKKAKPSEKAPAHTAAAGGKGSKKGGSKWN